MSSQQHQGSSHESNADLPGVEGGTLHTEHGSSYLVTVQMEEEYEKVLDADALHRLAIKVLTEEGAVGPLEVGIVVTTDEEVQHLNREYLGHDYRTDVLSFGMVDEQEFVTPEERPSYLGDVVISYERATEQAPEYGHNTDKEVATLLIHGLLHLLGYDDHEENERTKMHARQTELLKQHYTMPC
ncbi:MAG: rRNA maturation RNase YbeY [Chloroflexota bacterium]|nr:rRNA maturation RNase YbeY [Chloroflexota bacterium]